MFETIEEKLEKKKENDEILRKWAIHVKTTGKQLTNQELEELYNSLSYFENIKINTN